MMITEFMKKNNISIYQLSKNSGVPYTTINDLYKGRTNITKCSVETIYRIAKEIGVSMESLIEPYLEPRTDFELFKSNVCHRLKEEGDIDFVIYLLENDEIGKYYKKKWYPECLYLLAMLDYISRVNDVPICNRYEELRHLKLKEPLFPAGILILAKVNNDNTIKEKALAHSIPEFMRFNIVESEVRNVI